MQHTDIFSETKGMTMSRVMRHGWMTPWLLAASLIAIPTARGDVVTDWNTRANDIVAAAKLPPPPAYRVMAMVQTAVYEAVNAITQRYPAERVKLEPAPGASVEAAVAQANCVMLTKLVAAQQTAIDAACKAALSAIPDDAAKRAGIEVGDKAATAVLAWRADDGAATPESYRPRTSPGIYVPTVIPAVPQWPQRQPWRLARADQFRPGPPPKLGSKQWARDYNEIKAIGAKNSAQRSAEQTQIARFWEATGPGIYFPLARSVANAPGRELTQNARALALAGQAMDDALIAVMDAKYHYLFWRPVTAIRNGDRDGNAATERDGSWAPLIDTPMHPEYPCAHCIISGSVGAVLKAEIGDGPAPVLTTTSPTANGATRSWTSVDDFVREVANARVYDGVHYRTSTEVGSAMGKKIGELAATKSLPVTRTARTD